MKVFQAILLLAFLGAVGLFALQNSGAETFRFLNYQVTSSRALVTVATYLLGMLTGWVVVAFLTRSVRNVMHHDHQEARTI